MKNTEAPANVAALIREAERLGEVLRETIRGKRQQRAALSEQVRVLDAEISALAAAMARRAKPKRAPENPSNPRHGGGRRPGDISQVWRDVLAEMHLRSRPLSYEDISAIASDMGNHLAMSSVRDRVRNLASSGFLDGNAKTGFWVTQDAAARFGFASENEGNAASTASQPEQPAANPPQPEPPARA